MLDHYVVFEGTDTVTSDVNGDFTGTGFSDTVSWFAELAGPWADIDNYSGAEAEQSGAYRIVSADEMIRREADSEAWFGLDARPGFAFEDSARGPLLRASPRRAAGGCLEPPPNVGPGFVAYGRGVRRNLRIPEIGQLDIAPTIAELRGLELPGARGRALVGLLHLPADPRSPETGGGARGGNLP